MRNDLRRRLAAVAAIAATAALLSPNVAGAQPAATGSQGAPPAAQAVAGAPRSPEAIGTTPAGPDACPRLNGASPITPNSCGPAPSPSPPPLDCDLTVNPPELVGFYVKVKARVDCNRVVGSIALTVSLYRGSTRIGNPQSYDNTGRSSLDNYNNPLSRFCDAHGRYTGKASATVVRPYGEPGQPITLNESSAPRDIVCPGIS